MEYYDEQLRRRRELRPGWKIVRRDEATGKHEYLLDRIMGIGKHARMTEDAEAKMLEEAVQSSYRKGEENVAITEDGVSRETVMNRIHSLQFPKAEAQPEKKALKYLYINADEDYVALQYLSEKGDIKKPCANTVMPKLIYVYEGITDENGRREMINKKHFGGVYEGGEDIEKLWKEVSEYIGESYDMEKLEKIYINGDGAAWIKIGQRFVDKTEFVLDRFHMQKYIVATTSHLKDPGEDAGSKIYHAVHKQKKREAGEVFDRILAVTETESKRKTVEAAKE